MALGERDGTRIAAKRLSISQHQRSGLGRALGSLDVSLGMVLLVLNAGNGWEWMGMDGNGMGEWDDYSE